MNWAFGKSPVDDLVDKATSENLPAGTEDLALNLEICDQIRSKQVSPKDAARALKRRIGHKNPNVQLLALGLTDVCVKNGGQHFLVEVASREFVDNLTSIMKAPAGCNIEVKNKILYLIQTWGRLFRGKQGLGYVCDIYMILQHEGYEFPPMDNVGAALVETQAPPDWTDSDVCTRCRTAFTLTNRKHHCRACGATFCGQCSSKSMSLPHLGVTQEVRVCDGCWIKKKMGGKGTAVQDSFGLGGLPEIVPSMNPSSQQKPNTTTNASTSNAGAEDDDDLLKAIELSLKEANSRPGFTAPSSTRKDPEPTNRTAAPAAEEDDADLLAAIEASLRETNLNASTGTSSQPDQRPSAYAAYTYSAKTEAVAVDSGNDLSSTEKENIELFASLVDRIQMMNGDVAGNREVQALYEQISKLQTKVALSLEEADKKQREAMQFNDQVDQAVKMYDHLLQERLNSTYQRRMNANTYAYPGVQQQQQQQPQQQQHTGGSQPGFNTASSPHVYPNLTESDSRYNQYVPGAPYHQQAQPSFAPQVQPPYSYIPALPAATAPYAVSSPPAGIAGPDYATAPFASAPQPAQSLTSQPLYQPVQDPFYATAPMPSGPSAGQFHHQGFQPPVTGDLTAGQAPYAPYPGGQHLPQDVHAQAHSQAFAPAAPVVPAEEKPLIEF
ncbi:Vacuolar protein-sorting-associated protein 27 [Dissophora globulifera]|uniref:Vacuolar protein sorting-associated protein 27 n=1 Tax=Dissophora globulifera TaxID=979702 RepID=A0A9P6RG79_9FUNG|nr:Vacuolar protein-sorting-associated protein 27 [Dissophora globulifera]